MMQRSTEMLMQFIGGVAAQRQVFDAARDFAHDWLSVARGASDDYNGAGARALIP
jgi:hypothetical protein